MRLIVTRRCSDLKTQNHDRSSEHTFMSGVLVLTLSTVIVKIIGLAYKIPLMSILGAEGMGYFNTAYEIFALLCGVSTTGVPVAVSMLVSSARQMGNTGYADRIYKTSSAILLTKGVLFSGLLAVFAEPVARAVGNPQAYFALLAISPSLLFTCAAGAVRGYFQGCRIMTPTAVSQLTEALGKLLFGVVFSALAVGAGFSLAASAAFGILGVSLGSLMSALYLWIRKASESGERRVDTQKRKCVLSLLRISLPITACSALVGTTRVIDMTLMLRRLQSIGISALQANKIYGAYTTLALPVFTLVPAFIPPITESLIPRLAAAVEAGSESEQGKAVRGALRLTAFVAVPSSMGIMVYSEQILRLLFPNEEASIRICAPLLSMLGVSVLLSCIISTTNAVLQSYRRVILPIISLALGAVVKAVSAYILIGNVQIAQMGAPISTMLGNLAAMLLNCIFMSRVVKGKSGFLPVLLKPLLASVCAMTLSYALFTFALTRTDSQMISFALAFVSAFAAYMVLAVALGVVSKEDILMFKKKNRGVKNDC